MLAFTDQTSVAVSLAKSCLSGLQCGLRPLRYESNDIAAILGWWRWVLEALARVMGGKSMNQH